MSPGADTPGPAARASESASDAYFCGRVRSFLLVVGLGWASFALLNAPRGRWIATSIDVVAGAVMFALWLGVRASARPERARLATHAGILVSCLGVAAIGAASGQSQSAALWFLAGAPMFAAHLLSVRATVVWSGVVIALMALVHASEHVALVPAEYVPANAELLLTRSLFVLALLGLALASWRLTARHVAALEERERTISQQAQELGAARDDALEASRVKTEFLGRMSHELRTPMHGVIGMTGLLLETPLDATQREYADTVQRSGEALLSIVDDILDFSELEAGRVELEVVRFDAAEVARETVAFFERRAAEKGIALRLDVAADVPAVVGGDRRRFRQVLMILVGNAVKFTAQGGIAIRVELDPRGANGAALLRCTVEDSGIGIDAEHRVRVFEAFSQVDGSLTRRHGGTGLGLALASRLVALMGGEIGVDSEPRAGSRFWFTIRLHDAPTESVAESAAASPFPPEPAADSPQPIRLAPATDPGPVVHPSVATGYRRRILVADDNDVNQRVAVRMLGRLGYAVDVAGDGREAVAATRGHVYDLVLMDCQMPEMDGLQATREIRRWEAGARRTPIVAMTANVTPVDREQCLAAGMDDFLAKPVKHDALAALLLRYFPAAA
jgi:signal transduction histidine kinase/CheY-like chemotaxis protein